METEYTTSTGFKIFYGLLGLGVIIFAFVLLKITSSSTPKAAYLMPSGFLFLGISMIINIFRRKIVISESSIKYINVFRTTEISFDHIKGVRIGDKTIYIEPNDENYKRIVISDYLSIGDSESLTTWLSGNFKNLDKNDLEESNQQILQDTRLGVTVEQREHKLKTAKGIAIAYNIIGFVLCFALIPVHGNYLMVALMVLYPLLGIPVVKFSYGLTKFVSNNRRSKSYFIMLGFILPVFMMLIKSVGEYDLFGYDHIWLPVVIFSLIVCVPLVAFGINKSIGGVNAQVIFIIIASIGYGFGATVQTNCVLDKSEPKTFTTKIVDQFIHHGKSTSYYVRLAPWKPGQGVAKVEVSRSFYYSHYESEIVKVGMKEGALGIPWFYLYR
ncbi:MAG: hypothetical protein JST50_10405 [Bacteroidetes bacterium]|jgi:hypothetical protein|nr:hypothetical protein [Bacteroidota bacterium]